MVQTGLPITHISNKPRTQRMLYYLHEPSNKGTLAYFTTLKRAYFYRDIQFYAINDLLVLYTRKLAILLMVISRFLRYCTSY